MIQICRSALYNCNTFWKSKQGVTVLLSSLVVNPLPTQNSAWRAHGGKQEGGLCPRGSWKRRGYCIHVTRALLRLTRHRGASESAARGRENNSKKNKPYTTALQNPRRKWNNTLYPFFQQKRCRWELCNMILGPLCKAQLALAHVLVSHRP